MQGAHAARAPEGQERLGETGRGEHAETREAPKAHARECSTDCVQIGNARHLLGYTPADQ